jgi:hypothetical protein
VLESLKRDRESMLLVMSPPFIVLESGRLDGRFVFLPPGTDVENIAAISIKIDGNPIRIAGKVLPAEKKQAAMNPRPAGKK